MTIECIRCGANGRPSLKWKAVGHAIRRGRPFAYLECLNCGGRFYSSLPAALEAAQPFAKEQPQPVEAPPVPVPSPTLFGATPKHSQGFVKVTTPRSVAAVMDWARRAAGERDE